MEEIGGKLMILYWPVLVQKEGTYDKFWGKEQHTYDSCTSLEEVEDCFNTWIDYYKMEYEELKVKAVDYSLPEDNPNHSTWLKATRKPTYVFEEVEEETEED